MPSNIINPWHKSQCHHQDAFENFINHGGLPQPKKEGWRYSDTRKITVLDKPAALKYNALQGDFTYIDIALANQTTLPANIRDAIDVTSQEITAFTARNEQNQSIINANHAYAQHAIHINISKDLDKPIFIDTSNSHNAHQHICLNIADNINVELVNDFRTPQINQPQTLVLHINIGKNAHVKQQLISDISNDGVQLYYQPMTLCENATYHANMLHFGGFLHKFAMDITLNGEYAEAVIDGAFCGMESRHLDHHISIYHDKENCFSRQNLYSLLSEEAKGAFQGKTYVAPHAVGTNGLQFSRALMLSDKAQMNAKPELEIYADDVKCSHAATIGKLEEEQIFYLQSRGVDKKSAKRILAGAFLQQAFIDNSQFTDMLHEKLNHLVFA